MYTFKSLRHCTSIFILLPIIIGPLQCSLGNTIIRLNNPQLNNKTLLSYVLGILNEENSGRLGVLNDTDSGKFPGSPSSLSSGLSR